jgi:hypothetical protein
MISILKYFLIFYILGREGVWKEGRGGEGREGWRDGGGMDGEREMEKGVMEREGQMEREGRMEREGWMEEKERDVWREMDGGREGWTEMEREGWRVGRIVGKREEKSDGWTEEGLDGKIRRMERRKDR